MTAEAPSPPPRPSEGARDAGQTGGPAAKRPRVPVAIRSTTLGDVDAILELGKVCFPNIPPDRHWQRDQVEAHLRIFPEGQWVAEVDGKVVGSAMNVRVWLRDAVRQHTWRGITGTGRLTTHQSDGDALYGSEVMVHPSFRRRGIARKLYQARKDYVVRHGLKAFVAGGRIPGYVEHADEFTPQEYVAEVIAGELVDRTLTPQLKAGMRVVGILENYMTDPSSKNYATILLWQPPGRKPYQAKAPFTLDEVGYEREG